MFNAIMNKRILEYCIENKIICHYQDGFMPARGTLSHAFSIIKTLNQMKSNNIKPYIFFLDLSKAFDCIDRVTVYKRLQQVGVPRRLIRIIQNMYTKTGYVTN